VQERSLSLLRSAEVETTASGPEIRAFVLWQSSLAYSLIEPSLAASAAENSFRASLAIEGTPSDEPCGRVGGDLKNWIQQSVFSDLIKKDRISKTEGLLPYATESVRGMVIAELAQYYLERKDIARSRALLSRIVASEQYPFRVAADVLRAMKVEESADRMALFSQALNNFGQHEFGGMPGTANDFGMFVELTWDLIPPVLALEAINKVLEQAKSGDSDLRITMSSKKGSATLNSIYELRLFEFLPILEQLDSGKAESLLRENANVQSQLERYPRGPLSLDSNGRMASIGYSQGNAPEATGFIAREQIQARIGQQMNAIGKEAGHDPAQAISDALALPLTDSLQSASPRANMLEAIARATAKENPVIATSALREILRVQDQLSPQQMQGLGDLPSIYLDLGDSEGAQSALKALLKTADKLYAADVKPDSPNLAFKARWPSTELWRHCIDIADRLSPGHAEQVIAGIPDPEIAAIERVSLAGTLLGAPIGSGFASECRKNGSNSNLSYRK